MDPAILGACQATISIKPGANEDIARAIVMSLGPAK